MLNRSRSSILPTFQRLQASMREFDHIPTGMGMGNTRPSTYVPPSNAYVPPSNLSANSCAAGPNITSNNTINLNNCSSVSCGSTNWREAGEELRRLRSQVVITIERMLRAHSPHDVLTQVPENTDWQSKTFVLALKIERLMFLSAPSRENYLNEHTLRSRVQLLSRHLVRIRKRKNAMATLTA